jgi:hypothetical protein
MPTVVVFLAPMGLICGALGRMEPWPCDGGRAAGAITRGVTATWLGTVPPPGCDGLRTLTGTEALGALAAGTTG